MSEVYSQYTKNGLNPYEVLGVEENATDEEIKDARNRLARMHHPDTSTQTRSTHNMQTINAAYEILHDRDKRGNLDRLLQRMREQTTCASIYFVGFHTSPPENEQASNAVQDNDLKVLRDKVQQSFERVINLFAKEEDKATFLSISTALFQTSRKPDMLFLNKLNDNLSKLDKSHNDSSPELATLLFHAFITHRDYIACFHKFNPRAIRELSTLCQQDNVFKQNIINNIQSPSPQDVYAQHITWLTSLAHESVQY